MNYSLKDNDPNVFKSKMDEYLANRESMAPSGGGAIGTGLGSVGGLKPIPPELRGIIAQKLVTLPNAVRYTSILPKLLETIFNDPASIDMFHKNREQFQRNIENPQYLEMLTTRIQNEENDRRRTLEQPVRLEPDYNGNNNTTVQHQNQSVPYNIQIHPSHEHQPFQQQNVPFHQNEILVRDSNNVSNILPKIQDIYWNDFSLLLDFNNDLRDDTDNTYSLKFYKIANISKIQMINMVIEKTPELLSEDYIYIRLEEFQGRCFTSNQKQVFGRLIQSHYDDKYIYYYPDKDTCVQIFSSPINLDHLTLEFFDSKTNPLSLKEIIITERNRKLDKKKNQNSLILKSKYIHNLIVGDTIEGYLIKDENISNLNIVIDEIIDDYTFIITDVIGKIDKNTYWKFKIFRSKIKCSMNFKFYEINWNMITGKTLENAELKKLSQLISDDEDISKIDQPIINYIMSKMNTNQ